jgi:predicted DNA-binding transcriptional regulator AlpA
MAKILRYSDLTELGFGSRQTIWRKINAGEFPKPKNILGRPGWIEEEVNTALTQVKDWRISSAC